MTRTSRRATLARGCAFTFAVLALAAPAFTVASPAVAATSSTPASTFAAGPCAKPPAPIPELATARCGTLTVPENRAKPNSTTIKLSVAIIPAASPLPKPDPILWLAGGPGDDAITEIPMALAGNLNRDRDVIFMSQRGTYTADPSLTCPVVDKLAAETLNQPYDAPATARVYAKATATCRRQLVKQGTDLGAYNTLESVDDLEDLRHALGVDQWNVYGISYGTDYALNYMRVHPQGIRSVGIDGVFPPPLAGGVSAWTSAGEGINAVFAACDADAACHDRYGDIGATFRKLVRQYEAHPKTFTVQVEGIDKPVKVMISGGMLVQWTVSPGTHLAAQVPAAIDALAHGDAGPVASTWAKLRLNPAAVGVIGYGLNNDVSCGEWVPYETEAKVVATGRKFFPTFPISVLREAPNLQFMRSNCKVWDVPAVDKSVRDVTTSDIPTLVVSAQYDGQTASSFGPLVAKSLANATVVEIPNVAHVAFASPSPAANACTQSIARDFFDVLNAVDTSCATSVPPTDFEITPATK